MLCDFRTSLSLSVLPFLSPENESFVVIISMTFGKVTKYCNILEEFHLNTWPL
jgi:hypothetical protein